MARSHAGLTCIVAGAVAAACGGAAAHPAPLDASSWCKGDTSYSRVGGMVYDSATRAPVPNVEVGVQRVSAAGAGVGPSYLASTDSVGRYCVLLGYHVRPSRYRASVRPRPFTIPRLEPAYGTGSVEETGVGSIDVPYVSPERRIAAIRDSVLARIETQRAIWRSRRPRKYSVEAHPDCFCPTPRVIDVVVGDSVVGWIDPQTTIEHRTPTDATTIDRLFDRLTSEVRVPANVVFAISWDPHYGFPRRWSVANGHVVPDAYAGMTVGRFEVMEP